MHLIYACALALPLHQRPRLTAVVLLQEALALEVSDIQAPLGSQVRTTQVAPCIPRLRLLRHPCHLLRLATVFKSWDLSRLLNETKADHV